jgi:hypothetical protein
MCLAGLGGGRNYAAPIASVEHLCRPTRVMRHLTVTRPRRRSIISKVIVGLRLSEFAAVAY